jgi:hypothetical protein
MTTAESVISQLEQHGYHVKKIATLASPEAGDQHAVYIVSHPAELGCKPVIVQEGAAVVFRVFVPLPGDVHDQTAALTKWIEVNLGTSK